MTSGTGSRFLAGNGIVRTDDLRIGTDAIGGSSLQKEVLSAENRLSLQAVGRRPWDADSGTQTVGRRQWDADSGTQTVGRRQWDADSGTQGVGRREWDAGRLRQAGIGRAGGSISP